MGVPGSKLAAGGPIRARMVLYPAALMVNLRRLHGYLRTKVEETTQQFGSLSSLRNAVCRGLKRIHRRFRGIPTH